MFRMSFMITYVLLTSYVSPFLSELHNATWEDAFNASGTTAGPEVIDVASTTQVPYFDEDLHGVKDIGGQNITEDYGYATVPTEAVNASAVTEVTNATFEAVRLAEDFRDLNATLDYADPAESSEEAHLQRLANEVRSYGPLVRKILGTFTEGPEANRTYDELADFVDRFGHRMAGSPQLEDAIDYLVAALQKAGVDSVTTEPVVVPVWSRGEEKCRMLKPREMDMDILGLGASVPTVDGGITARVVLVKTFDELERRKDEVNGSIVVFNPTWKSYASYYPYRTRGAVEASRHGALAALVRSGTPFSLYTVHTGGVSYAEDVPRIPTAAITVEDADLLDRILARGHEVILHLSMKSNYSEGESRNIVADIKGTVFPEQYVIAGAHTDSWDVGQGAMDDGGGVLISVRMAQFLREFNLRPKRTIRIVLWTAEEIGYFGGRAFAQRHQSETGNISIALESDYGTFTPYGLTTSSRNNVTQSIMLEVLKLLQPINATELLVRTAGSDVRLLDKFGVPVSILLNRNDKYFHYHHSRADTMSMMDREALDLCTAMWVAVCYVFADLEEMLPR
ncbi:carboxypeptidase Q-like [Ornithodoros turicata]|uniref:carboxypeptidase Q-like n=1 Tax=Ornithodoros turicata TaxID=34597 RepID=UPI003138A861